MDNKSVTLGWVALVVLSIACAPPGIVMRYAPTVSAVPLDVATRPKVFLERVEDRTGDAPLSFGGRAAWRFVTPPSAILRQALAL